MAVFLFGRSGGDSLSPIFSENSWEQIIEVCQQNKIPDTWLVGDHKDMSINGVDYQIDIIGKYHDTYSDGTGKAPLTLQFRNCYATEYLMFNSETVFAGWIGSEMRSTHLPTILSLMPDVVKLGVRNVNKLTQTEDRTALETTVDGLFLLSDSEIFGTPSYTVLAEGVQYDYYKNGGNKIKEIADVAVEWWTRSSYGNPFVTVIGNGAAGIDGQYLTNGVSPAFCF